MKVTEEDVLAAVEKLGKEHQLFHTTWLARALSEKLGVEVKTDIARYWVTRLVLTGKLKRYTIATRLFMYGLTIEKAASLPASVKIRTETEETAQSVTTTINDEASRLVATTEGE